MTDNNQSEDVAVVDVFAEIVRMAVGVVFQVLPAVIGLAIVGVILFVTASLSIFISEYAPEPSMMYQLIMSHVPAIVWSALTVLVKVFVILWWVIFLYQTWKRARKRVVERKQTKEQQES